jgi:predicted aspartyl protease
VPKTRIAFSNLPNEKATRPIVEFAFADLPRVSVYGLVDTGANSTRIDIEYADELGIDLGDAKQTAFIIAGGHFSAYESIVNLQVGRMKWQAVVTFVEGWPYGHQILGLKGFCNNFVVRFDAHEERFELTPRKV